MDRNIIGNCRSDRYAMLIVTDNRRVPHTWVLIDTFM